MAPGAPAPVRIHAIYSGRVQGVGFRFTVLELASSLALGGFVRNLPDGDVEVVAEGDASVLDRLTGGIVASRLGRHIASADVRRAPPTGEFTDFRIRY